jgi:hypothetical protein
MAPTTSKPKLPYLNSTYLGREVWLDELADLTEQELRLLATEVDGLHADASASVARHMASGADYGTAEKLVRVSGRFMHAIEREEVARQRHQSFLELTNQLNAVTAERNTLRQQLDHVLEGGK